MAGYERGQWQPPPQRRYSGPSTGVEANLQAYPLKPIVHPHYQQTHLQLPYDEDDRESIRTAVVGDHTDEEPLYKSKTVSTLDSEEGMKTSDYRNGGGRTPSPTPSELKELKSGAIDWKSLGSWRFWIRRDWLWYYVIFVLIVTITVLVSVFHKQIVHALTPAANWLHDTTAGWVVPIAVLFVISFPPLFGHEIVAMLCGLVWGLWIGFGIVAAGTLLGEIGNFYAFKYCCRSRGAKLERNKISYACLAKVVRDGGFKIALIARLSAIPGHFTTAIFSTCGMGIIVFTIAAILSMPKQILGVYLGVILKQSEEGPPDKNSRILSNVVLGLTIVITVVAMWYIVRQMNKVKPQIIYRRRKARQAKFSRASGLNEYPFATGLGHRAMASESTIVVNEPQYKAGDKLSYTPSHSSSSSHLPLVAPQPVRPLSISQQGASHLSPLAGPYGSRFKEREESAEEVGWDMGAGRGLSDNPYRYQPTPPEGGSLR